MKIIENIKNQKEKLPNFNEKIIQILTFIVYILSMIIFEILYCNASNVSNIIRLNFSDINYNFSLCRLVSYIAVILILSFIRKFFINDAMETFEKNKYKKIFNYMYLFIATIIEIVAIVVVFKNPSLSRGISIGMIAVLMGEIFILYVSNNVSKNVVITALTLGMIFSISTKFNHEIDEKKHFMTTFNISFGNFDYIKNPITDKKIEELPQVSELSKIDYFLEKKYEPEITHDVNKQDVPSTPAEYNFVAYLFPALGITLARCVGGSIVDLYIMGRIFNLILYTILIYIATKLIPYKKNIFAVVFLIPMALVLAATYSIDGYCIGTVAVLIAYCLKLKEEKETINLKEFVLLVGLFLLMLVGKSMAYILVGTIFLMLPIKETLKKNKKYIPIMIVLTMVLGFALIFGIMSVKKEHIKEDSRAGDNISVSGQINSIMHNPILDIKVGINHINNTFLTFKWYNMLHDSKFFTKNNQAVLIPLLVFILYVSLTETDKLFNIKDKIIMLLSFIFVYGMTSLVLYLSFSPVGSLSIGGYQTRYILPILPLGLFCMSSKNITLKNIKNRNFNIAIISEIFIMLGVMQSILV